ncbi:MAG TPA: hypothetical protein VII38_17670 [Polyangia bacterium]
MRASCILVLVLACVAPAWAKGPTPLATFKPDSAVFIDDPFVVRDDGKAVAYISTDGANTAALHLAALPPAGPETIYAGLPVDVWKLRFLSPDRILVIVRDSSTGKVTAQVFSPKGATNKLGPVDDIELGTVKGKPAVVTYQRREQRGAVEHVIAAYDRQSFRSLGTRTLREDKEGRVASGAARFKILWWQDGLTSAAALEAGDYDQKHDIRRPNRFARFEVFENQLEDAQEIGDLLGFAQASLAHRKHPNQALFAHLSDDHRQLLLTDGMSEHPLTLDRALSMYDAATFAYQPLDGKRLALSFAIDPMNPEAQARKKAVPNDFELYLVDRASRKATLALALAGDGRPVTWRVGGDKVAVLHKSVGFDRGGVALEIYSLGAMKTAGR